MIKKIEMYTIKCDCCLVDAFENEEHVAWNTSSAAEELAENQGWLLHRGFHICPSCYFYDDDDNLLFWSSVNEKYIPAAEHAYSRT